MAGRAWQAAISAHRNPVSSRAIAVTTRFLESLRAASRRKRPHSRNWAAQARAATWGPGLLAVVQLEPDRGPVLVGPADSTSWAPRWALPHLVMWPAGWCRRWSTPRAPGRRTRERGRRREAAPVADLAGQRQRPEPGDAPVGGQATHRVGERRSVVPAGQVGPDRLQLGVAASQHRPVVGVGCGQGGLLKVLLKQPALGPAVAQQEPAQPVPGAGAVDDHVGAGLAQIPDRFFLDGRIRMATSSPARCSRASRRQSRRSVLTLSPGALGISEGAITSQRTCRRCSSRARS
jgi:hypothetical protein